MEKPLNKLLQGKKPTSLKLKVGPKFDNEDIFGNLLTLPKAFVEELKEYGFDCRFIDGIKFKKEGIHTRSWKIFNINDFKDPETSRVIIKADMEALGVNADGTIQRKELFLAVRPLHLSERHKAMIRHKTDIQSGKGKVAAQEIEESAARRGIKVRTEYDE